MQPTLIPTKLAPAAQAGPWLARPRLVRALTGAGQRAVLICAPAGYGKTTLMSQAYAQLAAQGERIGWVSCDRHDAAPVDFLRYLMAAARQACPGAGRRFFGLAGADAGIYLDTALAELAAIDAPLTLFLDDVHHAASGLPDFLEALVRYAPPTMRFVLSARDARRLPLWRLRAENRLAVIGAAELAFDAGEADAYFRDCAPCRLEPAQAAALLRATEGWAMGLQLARMALAQTGDYRAAAQRHRGGNPEIGGYLLHHVLDEQPDEVREFLLKTSILDRLCARNCDALLGHARSARMLDVLVQAGLFLARLEGEDRWFRYHPLFQEFLQQRLEVEYPDECATLRRSASLWFREHGCAEEALALARATEDMPFIAQTLEATSNTLAYVGNHSAFQTAARALPPAALSAFPRLALERAWMETMRWNFAQAHHLLELAQAHMTARADPGSDFGELLLHRRMVLAFHCGDSVDAARLCEQWLARYPCAEPFISGTAYSVLMFVRALQMDNPGLAAASGKALDLYQGSGLHNAMVWHNCILGLTHESRGEIDEALQAYTQAAAQSGSLVGAPAGVLAMPAVLTAHVHYERNALDRARQLIDATPEAGQPGGLIEYIVAYFMTRSRLAAASGSAEQALAILEQGMDFAASYALPHIAQTFEVERVRQLLAAGGIDQARDIGARLGLRPDAPRLPAEGATLREANMAMTWGRIALASGQSRSAATAMQRWMEHCMARKCHRQAVLFAILAARGKWLARDTGAAMRLLAPAVRLSARFGFVRTWIDEGAPARTLLLRLYETDGPLAVEDKIYTRVLLSQMGGHADPAEIDIPQRLDPARSSPLNNRELEILALVSQGITGRFVGLRLGITEGTVKWYMQRIFDKLGVRGRRQAIDAARALGLVG